MKRTKRFSLLLAWVVLTMNLVLALAVPVLADTGEKPSVSLKILNAPSENFCLALFTKEEARREGEKENKIKAFLEQKGKDDAFGELTKKVFEYEGNGYEVAWNPGHRFFIENSDNSYYSWNERFSFSYDAPSTFKVCVVTKDNCVMSDQEITTTRFRGCVVFDYKTGELYEDLEQYAEHDRNFLKRSIGFFISTVMVEGFLLLAFGLISVRNVVIFLIMNLLTQSYLHFYNWSNRAGVKSGNSLGAFVELLGLEIVITIVETVVYAIAMKEKNNKRWKCVIYGIVANLISACFGLLLP
ncbi:MAG: hypothetical protein K6F31_11875 [Acetatifactor sp.]|nr:hypothetical protein [Acetatifactor sp.]